MERFLKAMIVVLGVALAGVYVAAKVHFFTRYNGDVGEYLSGHWPYWAAMLGIGALLWLVGTLAEKGSRRPPT